MRNIIPRKKSSLSGSAVAAVAVGCAVALVAAGAWYLWFRPDEAPLTDAELKEIEAFDAYERQKPL
jgi:hypothetical protein